MLKKKNCDICGKEFEYNDTRRKSARCCSLGCLGKIGSKSRIEKRRREWETGGISQYLNDLKIKLEKHTTKTDKCWTWNRSKNKQGYGSLMHRCKVWKVHRASYIAYKGEIPDGLQVLHTCDNPSCVNPDHLFLGTNLDNVNDRVKKGRTKFRSKLTIEQVQEIKKLLALGVTMKRLANDYNVSDVCICYIKQGKSWKNLNS